MFNSPKIYRVYLKDDAEDDILSGLESAVFVKDGFSITAFVFNIFWAIYYRTWLLGFLYVAALTTFLALQMENIITMGDVDNLNIGLMIWFGFEASDWYGSSLTRRGYIFYDIVSGANEFEAKRRFLTNQLNPMSHMV